MDEQGKVQMAAEDPQVFGALLRQHRLRAGLTQEALAERAALTPRGLIHLERGTRRPYPDTIHRLAEALHLTNEQRAILADAARPTGALPDTPLVAPAPPTVPAALIPPLSITSTPLVGRDHELTILRHRIDAALAGRGSLVLISGEAGIGKTALAEAVCREATSQGALVLVGRCYDLTETPPYGPWTEARAQYPPSADLPPRPSALHSSAHSPQQFFAEVHDFFVAAAARRPIALLLDDLHWADPASLDLLRFLARSLSDLPMVILATYRSDELTRRHPLYQLLPALVRESGAERLDLRPLDRGSIRALIAARYPLREAEAARLAAYLHTRTDGNALFVGELLRALGEEGVLRNAVGGWELGDLEGIAVPALLRQVIDGRVGRLDDEAQHLLAVAAVIGQEAPITLWAAVAGVDEEALLATIEQAEHVGLLAETPDGAAVRFMHALIREAIYEGEMATRRRRVHRTVAEALAAMPRPDPDAVAWHFQRADDERALPWLHRAGERAQAAYAWATAAARFEAVLTLMEKQGADEEERGWLLLRLCGLLRYVAVAQARACADEAVRLARTVNDRVLAAYARFQSGQLACFAGDVADGLPELVAGAVAMSTFSDAERVRFAAHAAEISAPLRLPEGWGTVILWQASSGHYREALALGESFLAEAENDEELIQSIRDGHYGLGIACAALAMPDDAMAMFARARETYLREGHHALVSQAARHELAVVALPYRAEDIAGRLRLAELAEIEHERASGAVPSSISPRALRLPLLIVEGQWEEAERLAEAGSAETRGHSAYRTRALVYLARLARLRGDAERARWAVREALPAGRATEPGSTWPFEFATATQQLTAALALDTGDLQTAKEWLVTQDRWLAWSGSVLGRAEGQVLWAQYYWQAGEIGQAYEHANRALQQATEPRQPLALLAAHRLLGEFDTRAGRYEDAARHLDTSLVIADACQAPYEHALTRIALAALRVATGVPDDARALLDEAREICEPLGAKPALARIAALDAQLEATPSASLYPAGLSAREIEVLRLIAQGMTDTEAAEHLFLSPRTVGQHLRSIYNKLGISSRTAATRFAVEHCLI